MFFALGFLIAGLLALLFLPVMWARAMRLTLARLERKLPLSFADIEADRDQMRAQFAVEKRQIEQKAAIVTAEKAEDLAELGRRAVTIARLEENLARTQASLAEREQELAQSRDFGERTQNSLNDTAARLAAHIAELANERAAHGDLRQKHDVLSVQALETHSRLVETSDKLSAAETAIERMTTDLTVLRRTAKNQAADLQALTGDHDEALRQIASFETRRSRLLAKIAVEKERAAALEAERQGLRASLPVGAPEADVGALRAAILDIGRKVAGDGELAKIDRA